MGAADERAPLRAGAAPRAAIDARARRMVARRFGRNLRELADASDAEFAFVESLLGEAVGRAFLVGVVTAIGSIVASGWPVVVQLAAICALATVVAVLLAVWRHHLPPPEPEPEPPPFARLTPRRRHAPARPPR